MTSENQKRVTVRLKCPNPLFEEWLISWKEQAAAKESKMQYIFNHALQSLRKYPIPLQSGRDCKILKGFGDKLCKMLDEKLKEHKKTHGTASTMNSTLHPTNIHVKEAVVKNSKKKASVVPQEVGSASKSYIPQYGSGGYAILITLYKQSLETNYPGFLNKAQIIQHGKSFVNSSFTKPIPGSRYTAWSSMRTLLSKNLVSKISHPPKFSLTEEGEVLARKLYVNSNENDNNKNSNNDEIQISSDDENIKTNRYLGTKCTSEEFTSNFTECSNANTTNITDNCKLFDVDIPDEFTDELLRNNWIPENDTFSVHINNDVREICEKTSESRNEKYFLEPIETLRQASSKISTINRSVSSESVNSKNIYLDEGELISSRVNGKCSFQKLYSTDSVSSKQGAIDVSSKNKENTLKRFASSSSITSTTSTVSVVENFVMAPNSFDIILYVDNNETSGSSNSQNDEILVNLTKQGVKHEVRNLKVGDFVWVCRDRITKKELVLPYIIERKRMDDFAHSIKDKRYYEQKFRLKKSGIENLIYLVESHGKNQHVGLPLQSLYQAASNTAIQENFFIKFTESTKETVDYLVNFSRILVQMFKSKTLASCSKDVIQPVDIHDDLISLITFKELNESSVKNKRMKISELFVKMLVQLKGMSVDRALAITQIYPTPILLKNIYQENSGSQGEKLLAGIKYGRYGKSIGIVLSKTVYQAFNKTQY